MTVEDTQPVVDATTRAEKLTHNFLKLTGYKRLDILASNEYRRTFVTSNGGKYQLNSKGTQVKVLCGPQPPSVGA